MSSNILLNLGCELNRNGSVDLLKVNASAFMLDLCSYMIGLLSSRGKVELCLSATKHFITQGKNQ